VSELPANDPDEDYERPAALRRMRSIARVVFGAIALFVIGVFALGLWHVISDVWKNATGR
jgi:hypothetical protein